MEVTNNYQSLDAKKLIAEALARKEGIVASSGALSVKTGSRTGRSPNDRFIVDDQLTHESIDWGTVNKTNQSNTLSIFMGSYHYLFTKTLGFYW